MAVNRGRAAPRARVQITYDQGGDGDGRHEVPFVLGVLGDFAGKPDPALPKLREREFVEISGDSFNNVMNNMRPRLQFTVPNRLVDDGSKLAVTLHVRGLEDFEPEQVARQVEPLRQLIAVREQMSALRAQARKNGHLEEHEQADLRARVATLIDQLDQGSLHTDADIEAMLSARIADIDALLSAQVNEIIHAPEFQRLEASWRGLQYVLAQADVGPTLKVRVLHVSKDDLRKDLETASEFDQSALFKKIYEDEYGTFGGEPFAALIGDYEFGRHPQDIALLERISNVAAAAHAPFLSAASPALFGSDSFAELTAPRDLARIFTSAEYVKWRAFRDSDDARYAGLVLPRILLREPYTYGTVTAESFTFQEDTDGTEHRKFLWGNPAYAFGARLADAFGTYHWCAMIRGVDGGGLVEGWPAPRSAPTPIGSRCAARRKSTSATCGKKNSPISDSSP